MKRWILFSRTTILALASMLALGLAACDQGGGAGSDEAAPDKPQGSLMPGESDGSSGIG